jgi:hypothetical protein
MGIFLIFILIIVLIVAYNTDILTHKDSGLGYKLERTEDEKKEVSNEIGAIVICLIAVILFLIIFY